MSKYVKSLSAGMLFAILLALTLGGTTLLLSRYLITDWIQNTYNSPSEKSTRYEEYLADLQTYVSKNDISSEDTAEISKWVQSNRNVYLFIYKDKQLFYDSIDEPNNSTDTDKGEEENTEGDGEDTDSSEEDDTQSGAEGDGEENVGGAEDETRDENVTEDDKPDTEEKDTGKKEEGSTVRPGTGLIVDYPTREQIIATAERNGLRKLDLSDGTLFVSLADYSDYLYYELANIISITSGVLIVVIVLMFYFRRILSRISRLARDVSGVYEVDMNSPIRTDDGANELATLTRNVEQMRSTMVESLQKEKEAINANTELITSMSHDIRTPLTVLLGYINIMKEHNDDSVMEEYIKAAEGTALKLKDLSDDMFRYFLVFGGGELETELIEYDAETILDQLFAEHILLLKERGYQVEMRTSKDISSGVKIVTDAPNVARIVDNIFSNIYKYADKERMTSVAVGCSRGRLMVAVKNYVLESAEASESNKIGLKTCAKLCEALGMGFKYFYSGKKNQKQFTVVIDFPAKDDSVENGTDD